jgi:hypothetical protein
MGKVDNIHDKLFKKVFSDVENVREINKNNRRKKDRR